ncbi:hypothetical protein EV286_112140 [Rhizobium sp. BK251]|nr:hypothetical protein EV286_112140 [Rhizobium sp. BK251]
MEANLGKGWKEEVRSRHAPDDGTLRPRGYPRCKERGRRAVDRPGSAARDFMQGAVSETARGKDRINGRRTERQALPSLRDAAFQSGDAFAQFGDG